MVEMKAETMVEMLMMEMSLGLNLAERKAFQIRKD